jgi:hypothetical protein
MRRRRVPDTPLCYICLSMFTAIRTAPEGSWRGVKPRSFGYPSSSYLWGGSHHTIPGSFLGSVRSGCYICSTIFRDCNGAQRKVAENFQIFYRIYKLQEEEFNGEFMRYGLRFGIEVEQNDQDVLGEFFYDCQGDFKILPSRGMLELIPLVPLIESRRITLTWFKDIQPWINEQGIPINTSNPICLRQARKWLMDCISSHKACQRSTADQQFYPPRLLNLGCNTGEALCRLQNCATELPSGPYCTLSHCWGRGQFLNLTTETIDELERGIPVSSLSRTFQDAIVVTKELGVRYLWIDALCIIQDSSEDWENEAARMSEIYAKSYCNIAATDATDGQGCFGDRLVRMVEPCLIDSSTFMKEPCGDYVVAYDDFWSINLRNAPLHQRGWVLQERLLSPRTIHFGSEQIFWECQYHTACESYPQGIPTQLKNLRTKTWRLFDPLLSGGEGTPAAQIDDRALKLSSYHEKWSRTVEWYMECKITKPRDKLVAIAGIAHKVAEATHERYLAGLWDNQDLAIQLLWHVLSRRQADDSPSTRPETYRAPSWSWASLEATIVWHWPTNYDKVLLSVVESTIIPHRKDVTCEIRNAALAVSGYLFKARVEIARVKIDGSYDEDGDYNLLVDYEEIHEDGNITPLVFSIAGPVIHLDTAMTPVSTKTVYCLPVCTGWVGNPGSGPLQIAGLLLVQGQHTENGYSRIGIFGLNKTEACHFCGLEVEESDHIDEVLGSMARQEITII